jgi:glycosyltransferase involved in cell wall biosynthesis
VSRLDPFKRVDTLIEAVSGLDPALPWRVDIVGDGPSRADLEAMVGAQGVIGRVHFHGWQKNPYPFMAKACVTVLSSTYEGFSNTVLESMALGTPVITSFCSSDARQMVERGAALGFEVGDGDALCKHLVHVLSRPGCSTELSLGAVSYIAPHITDNAVPSYERLIIEASSIRRKYDCAIFP